MLVSLVFSVGADLILFHAFDAATDADVGRVLDFNDDVDAVRYVFCLFR